LPIFYLRKHICERSGTMAVPRLGLVQSRIMSILWKRGQATAREITERLNKESPIAHSTVQTLLRKLESKDAVRHKIEDRTLVFYPAISPEKVARSATRELIDRLFGGSPAGLVVYLLRRER